MWHEIGSNAGAVLRFVSERGECSTLQIRSALKIPQTLLFLSLGWLAREGKVAVVYRDRGYWVRVI